MTASYSGPAADPWGADPSVRIMRRIFKGMEAFEKSLLAAADISLHDKRLPDWRRSARKRSEGAWEIAVSRGISLNEEEASVLYAHCLRQTLTSDGVTVSDGACAVSEKISGLLRERMK